MTSIYIASGSLLRTPFSGCDVLQQKKVSVSSGQVVKGIRLLHFLKEKARRKNPELSIRTVAEYGVQGKSQAPGSSGRTSGTTDKKDKVAALRQLLQGETIVQGPCCYDALGARLVEMAGFPLAVMSGFSVSASRLGQPDTGLLSYGEMVDQAGLIASAVDIPLIADADTGYGNVLNVKRTVWGYQQAGVAALILEDQAWPKACGHTRGRQVVPREEAVMRIRAAVDARDEGPGDILVVARSDARQAESLEEAIWRAQAFADVGADMVFVDALASWEEMAALCKAVPHTPKMANMLEGGVTPVLPPLELQDLGFQLVVYPLSLLGVSIRAMQEALVSLKSGRLPPPYVLPSFEEIKSVVGFDHYYAEEKRYSSGFSTPSPSAPPFTPSPPSSSSSSSSSSSASLDWIPGDLGSLNVESSFAGPDAGEMGRSRPSVASGLRDEEDAPSTCVGDFECDDDPPAEAPSAAERTNQEPGQGRPTQATSGEGTFSASEAAPSSPSTPTSSSFAPKADAPSGAFESNPSAYRAGSERRESDAQARPRGRANEVVEAEVLEGDGSGFSSGRYSSSPTASGAFALPGGLWSRVVRVSVSDRAGNVKLDFRVPAGFLDGLAGTIPAVAGVNLKALLNDTLKGNFSKDGRPILDVTDRTGTGDRVQIFLE